MGDEREKVRIVLAEVPRGALLVAAVFASLPSLAILVAMNLQPSLAEANGLLAAFTALYLVQLPLSIYVAGYVVRISARLAEVCGDNGEEHLAAAAALVPLGFIVPLMRLGKRLLECKIVSSQRIGSNGLDLVLNVMTLGLHSILYAALLEKIINTAVEEEHGEDDAAI